MAQKNRQALLKLKEQQDKERLIRLQEVRNLTGQSRTAIYNGCANGTFPKPIKIGPRAVAWLSTEVSRWITDRIRAARGDKAAA